MTWHDWDNIGTDPLSCIREAALYGKLMAVYHIGSMEHPTHKMFMIFAGIVFPYRRKTNTAVSCSANRHFPHCAIV